MTLTGQIKRRLRQWVEPPPAAPADEPPPTRAAAWLRVLEDYPLEALQQERPALWDQLLAWVREEAPFSRLINEDPARDAILADESFQRAAARDPRVLWSVLITDESMKFLRRHARGIRLAAEDGWFLVQLLREERVLE
ncbi:MAG TPA: hypothetical protein PLS90_17265, partial [Candidatus Sumerlaeota bacterium]|nr:hypothetical protein [Candidatus Sumerlaeota bacterium]